MDYMIFQDRLAARAAAERMRGWFNPRAARIYWPDHKWATKGGNVWVVAVGDSDEPKYLRNNGLVE